MPKIAVIGSGIAGLGCAYFLNKKFDVVLYEQNDYAGGHINTLTVNENGRPIPIDTGFMVYNEITYPHLTRLFKELQVKTKPTKMSFSVQDQTANLEYSGTSVKHLFAQRRNILNLRFMRMLFQVHRFNQEAVMALENAKYESYTLKQFVDEKGYGADFLNSYLIPMSSAVWSTPTDLMLQFPAITLIRFFHNHGFLGLHTQHPWRTIENGAKTYVERMTGSFKEKIKINDKVKRVTIENERVKVVTQEDQETVYDKVIFACHADQALSLLARPSEMERALLGKFKYQANPAVLHTDSSVMPNKKLAWSSWNVRIERGRNGTVQTSTHYWMNSLQEVSKQLNYFVTLNDSGNIQPHKILKKINYEHPVFTLDAIRAQKELPKLNLQSNGQKAYFCGSYFKYGFHEDAFTSSLELCRVILREPIWE